MEKVKYKILLIPFHQHLLSLYEGLFRAGCLVTGLAHESHLNVRSFGPVKVESVKYFVGYPLVFYWWFSIGFQTPKYIRGLSGKVKQLAPDVLVVFDLYHWYFLQALYIKRRDPLLKLVVYSETKRWPKRIFSSWLLRFFLSHAKRHQEEIDRIFVYTVEGRDFLSNYISPEKIHVVPAPVDTKVFTQGRGKERFSSGREFRILCNARFDPYKNHHDLLAAVRLLLDRGYKCHLTLIGRAEGGKERVVELVHRMALERNVSWVDPLPIEAMPDLYRSHDVLVLPSYNEAIGMVVPEAMACGIPTITSDTVGANVYVTPNETGLIFETANVESLASAILYYINSPDAHEKHGHAAAAKIRDHYSVEKVADRFMELLLDKKVS